MRGMKNSLVGLLLGLAGCTATAPAPEQQKPKLVVKSVILKEFAPLEGVFQASGLETTDSGKYLQVYASPRKVLDAPLYVVLLDNFDPEQMALILRPGSVWYSSYSKSIELYHPRINELHFTKEGGLGFHAKGFSGLLTPRSKTVEVEYNNLLFDSLTIRKGSVDFNTNFDNNRGWNFDKFSDLVNRLSEQPNPWSLAGNPFSGELPVNKSNVCIDLDFLAGRIEEEGRVCIKTGNEFAISNALARRWGHEILCEKGETLTVVSRDVFSEHGYESVKNVLVADRECKLYNSTGLMVRVDGSAP